MLYLLFENLYIFLKIKAAWLGEAFMLGPRLKYFCSEVQCLFNCGVYRKSSIKRRGVYLFHRDFGASLAVYSGCGAVLVTFPGRFFCS